MKRERLSVLTRLGRFFLLLSILFMLGIILFRFYDYMRFLGGMGEQNGTGTGEIITIFQKWMDLIGLEMFFGFAMDSVFWHLFKAQALGRLRIGGLIGYLFWFLFWMAIEDMSLFGRLLQGGSLSQEDMALLLFRYGIPFLLLAAVYLGRRPFAVLAALCVIPYAAWNLRLVQILDVVVGNEAVASMMAAKALECLGIFFGLLGVKRPERGDT